MPFTIYPFLPVSPPPPHHSPSSPSSTTIHFLPPFSTSLLRPHLPPPSIPFTLPPPFYNASLIPYVHWSLAYKAMSLVSMRIMWIVLNHRQPLLLSCLHPPPPLPPFAKPSPPPLLPFLLLLLIRESFLILQCFFSFHFFFPGAYAEAKRKSEKDTAQWNFKGYILFHNFLITDIVNCMEIRLVRYYLTDNLNQQCDFLLESIKIQLFAIIFRRCSTKLFLEIFIGTEESL